MNYFRKRKNAFGYALKGLRFFFSKEDHAKVHAIAGLIAVLLGFILKVTIYEWLVIILCIAIVLSAEAINSALEKLTDIASPEFSEKAGAVKDIAAGAVFIVSVAAAIAGAIIFLPKIIAFI